MIFNYMILIPKFIAKSLIVAMSLSQLLQYSLTLLLCDVVSQTRGCLAQHGTGLSKESSSSCGSAGERSQDT